MGTTIFQYEVLPGFTPVSHLGPYRASDYWKLPEGEPVELIRGRLIVSPAPKTLHQTVSLCLGSFLLEVARRSHGRAFAAPTDVVLAEHSIVQPDLLYIRRDRRSIVQDRIEGPPDLVIEILSEQDHRRDRVDKLELYAESGVAEYWLVDPREQQFEFLINHNGKFEIQSQRDNRYTSPICPEIQIDLGSFWTEIENQLGEE